jgi:4-cresol dehydrogenase (hydroxylating)
MASTRPLPPGVPAATLDRALLRLARIVGDDALLTCGEALWEFRDPYTFAGWERYLPSAVVQPSTVGQVQDVVRVAGELGVPLWTTSQGRNNGYGGSAPRVSGSVVVNLRRMNRVLEVSEAHAYAVVEPGVSFFDLYEAVRGAGHRLWISTPDLGWGSVVGNTLDHGFGFTVNGDHVGAQCGMEVVLADGSLLRTGMGAMEGNRAWHVHKRGFGPSADGLFMQSNFGIVTKMGVWLMPEPEAYRAGWIRTKRHEDLGPIVDALRPLVLDRTINGYPTVWYAQAFAAMRSVRSDWYTGEGPLPESVFAAMVDEYGIGRWNVRVPITGRREVIDAQWRAVEAAAASIPGAWTECRLYPGDVRPEEVDAGDQVPAGIPGLHLLERLKWFGGVGGHVGFSPIAPLSGANAVELDGLVRTALAERGLDYNAAFILNPRAIVLTALMFFDTGNEEQARAAFDVCRHLVREAARRGFGEYRAHLDFMDLVAEQYDFGDHAQRRFNERLKGALDPKGILSPGKQGIWPGGSRPTPGAPAPIG